MTIAFVQDTLCAGCGRFSLTKSQKTYFDERVSGPAFAVDQLVGLYWPRPQLKQQQRELQRLYKRCWKICLSWWSFSIAYTTNGTYPHYHRLVPCSSPEHKKKIATGDPWENQPLLTQSSDSFWLPNGHNSAAIWNFRYASYTLCRYSVSSLFCWSEWVSEWVV